MSIWGKYEVMYQRYRYKQSMSRGIPGGFIVSSVMEPVTPSDCENIKRHIEREVITWAIL